MFQSTVPTGATTLYPWEEDRDGEPVRYFTGASERLETRTGSIEVRIEGTQTADNVTRAIVLTGIDDVELTADQARRLAEALGSMLEAVEQ